jgi:two-component system, NarL family, nitrate/nitrite response regulator NarL
MKVRLLVVDDHRLFREGLRALLETAPDLEIAAEAGDSRDAVHMAAAIQPDLIVLDVGLPGSNGVAAIPDLRRVAPRARILVLTMHTTHEYVRLAFAAGAIGYAVKDQTALEIVEAMRAVARGEKYLAPQLPQSLLQQRTGSISGGPLHALSPREREIFDLAVRGFSNQGIAGQLCISVKTVETHRAHINKKLGVHSAAELIRFAARHGLVSQ